MSAIQQLMMWYWSVPLVIPWLVAHYQFEWWLTTDSSGNWYTLTQRNSPTNPSWIIGSCLSTIFSWSDDPWGTSEGASSNYMYYSTNNMGITATGTVVFNCLVNVLTTPASGKRYCFMSKQVPWTSYVILYENNGWTPRLRFIRNRDYVGTDDTNYNVTLTVWQTYMITMKYVGTTLTWYLDAVQVATRSSSGTWSTTTYTGLRIWQTGNNFWWSYSNHLTDEVVVANTDRTPTFITDLYTSYWI